MQLTMSKANSKSFPGQVADAAELQSTGEVHSPVTAFEPYVPPEVVADFLAVKRREYLSGPERD